MTPQQALEFFRNWTLEIMPAKHIDVFNQAFVTLSRVIAEVDAAKQVPSPKPTEGMSA